MSKVILLTGASRGIGLSIAHYLLKQSHKVTLVARTETPLRELEQQYPNQTAILTGDLADLSLGQKAIDLTVQQFGQLDGVIVNHGVLDPVKRVVDSTAEEWRDAYNINFFSAVAIAKAAIPHLRKSSTGTIIFTSSGAASNSYPTWGAYGSSKAALNHLASSIANEEKDVVAIAVRPGVVDTEMQRDIREKHHEVMDEGDRVRFAELKSSGGLLRPEQPGHVMAKLVLEGKRELSGQFLSWNAEELKAFQE
ncbi:Putative short-chain dehydrogenase/reductase SDR, NAD(P)-binding domain superfamily [Septoria linicola]|uniref:Short-chain dehydrogenase/reductase SDR, NAD(P)-binding domain superfamily n=1 Tax=Septoria linicola TaxID=215465 RepID=A0A9Q9AUI3_9PEZI|nr:putative short-chain dehydrogenase/reductase SDR, NAD(P)-binding domain superfamily [Septoria linicola]USW55654.1 Putative short-chain dehydrogenase/reductase SDR, NAD(P)-binding domain superfamily [Septoria linicola]